MRRLARLDQALLLGLVPLWLALFALHVRQVLLTGLAEPPVYAWESWDPDGYPTVGAFRPELHREPVGLEIGDRLLRVGRIDLRGAGYLGFYAGALAETDTELRVPVVFERGGTRGEVLLQMRRPWIDWYWIPGLLCTAVTAVLVLLRAPDATQARLFFVAMMAFVVWCTSFHGQSWILSLVSRGVVWYGTGGIAIGLVWLWVICFPGEVPRHQRLSPAWALLPAAMWYASRINYVSPGWPAAIVPGLKGTLDALVMAGGLGIATRNYRLADPIGRRRVKWVLYGGYLGVLGPLVARALSALDPDTRWYESLYVSTTIAFVAFPLGTLIAIVGYNLFDIDRLISATASYSLLLLGLLVGLLALAAPLATFVSATTGMNATVAQAGTAVALACGVIPLGGRLRPLVDRVLFAERYEFEQGMGQALHDLSGCTEPDAVTTLVAERVSALLRPERVVVYAGTGDAFAPAFVRDVPSPPTFAGATRLIASLAREAPRIVVLDAKAPSRVRPAARLDDFAPLQALAICVVVPIRRGAELSAFLCLGRKRSGDIYTAHDLTLLGALAEKASSELLRFRDAETIAQARVRTELLRVQTEEARRVNVARSRFLAAASHDLRQPLHALGLFVGALRERPLDAGARDLVERIHGSSRALEEMFDALLDTSKLDAGVVEVQRSDVALRTVLDTLAAEFEPQAAAKGLSLRVRRTRLAVRTDPLLLARILRNLVSNAIRYTDRGRVVVGCRRRGPQVRIQVLDTGRGIPRDRQGEVFEEFRRLGDGVRGEGLGLGLSIVQRLSRLLEHGVELVSVRGRGSVFTLTVPRAVAPPAAGAEPPRRFGVDLRGTVVLVVDDDATVLDAMREQLERWGCRVLLAASPAEACDGRLLGTATPDAIIADHQLAQGERGIAAIAAVRARVGRDVPAVLVTGATAADDLREARASGVPLLHKPLAPAKLRAALAQLVQR